MVRVIPMNMKTLCDYERNSYVLLPCRRPHFPWTVDVCLLLLLCHHHLFEKTHFTPHFQKIFSRRWLDVIMYLNSVNTSLCTITWQSPNYSSFCQCRVPIVAMLKKFSTCSRRTQFALICRRYPTRSRHEG